MKLSRPLERPIEMRRILLMSTAVVVLVLKEYPTSAWLHATYFQFGVVMSRIAAREPERWMMVARIFERAAASTSPAIAAEAKAHAAKARRKFDDAPTTPRPMAD
jgi:hypothetical protein